MFGSVATRARDGEPFRNKYAVPAYPKKAGMSIQWSRVDIWKWKQKGVTKVQVANLCLPVVDTVHQKLFAGTGDLYVCTVDQDDLPTGTPQVFLDLVKINQMRLMCSKEKV